MKKCGLLYTAKIVIAGLALAAAGTLTVGVGSANAFNYGTVITKYDGNDNGNGIGTLREDNEEEPGMVQSQAWDLEGFLLNGKKLSIVGGYNFYTGKDNLKAGDIFIDTNGDAIYSPNTIPSFNYNPGYQTLSNVLFKYDYVLDIDWSGNTFNIVQLNQSSLLKNTEYGAAYNTPSNPWIYVSSSADTIVGGGIFETHGKASQTDTGFDGWTGDGAGLHYAATFDISVIDLSNGAVFHNTMECGNDNLIGQVAPVPEPSTFVLLGAGLLAAGLYRRNKQK
jgi:hypothetical protein